MAYWALKTRESGDKGKSFDDDAEKWPLFVRDGVIAIGWILKTSPEQLNDEELQKALKPYGYKPGQARTAAWTIRKFQNLGDEDSILICQGYTANERPDRDIPIYGVATNIKKFRYKDNSDWWYCQHKAEIERFGDEKGKPIKKSLFEKKLGQGSLMFTLQPITKKGFENIVQWARH